MCAESVFVLALAMAPIAPVPAPRGDTVPGPYKGLPAIVAPHPDPTALCTTWCVQRIDGRWRLRHFAQYPWHLGLLETLAWELAPDVDVSEWLDAPCRGRGWSVEARPFGVRVE